MDREVIIIPKQPQNEECIPVAVYCRVSTTAERAEDSLENQKSHYQMTIGQDSSYELVGLYYDFGISGYTSTRPGFQRMMDDAEKGRFNLVITKAITRFARNTNTVLTATRRLKELGIGVFFELQGINTLSQEGEMLMTILAAFGQAESEGARQHTLMALKQKNKSGHFNRQLQRSMGYRKGEDGEFYPDEYAPLVLEMFELAADGYSAGQITNYFNSRGLCTQNGKPFNRSSVTKMLRNPAYMGDFVAQQYYVDEHRHQRKNMGEKPKYYVCDDHIPIVSRELWEKAQETLDRGKPRAEPTQSKPMPLNDENYPYRHRLFCAQCGHKLNRAIRVGRVLWECNGKTRFGKAFCSGVSVTDDEVRAWLPITEDHYVIACVDKGVVSGHDWIPGDEWKKTNQKKKHVISVPELTEENYPYMNRLFCRYCGSRLRRIISNAGKVFWVCNAVSRGGKQFCKGVRVPDEKLKPLRDVNFDAYIGKEIVNGKENYGYSRKPEK